MYQSFQVFQCVAAVLAKDLIQQLSSTQLSMFEVYVLQFYFSLWILESHLLCSDYKILTYHLSIVIFNIFPCDLIKFLCLLYNIYCTLYYIEDKQSVSMIFVEVIFCL